MFFCKSGTGDREVGNMAAVQNEMANFALEEYDKVKKGSSASAIMILFGDEPKAPLGGEYDYLPEYRNGRTQRIVLGFNGEKSSHANLYTGLQRIVSGSIGSAAKKIVQEMYDNLMVSATVFVKRTEHRGTIAVTDADGTTITYYVYYVTMNHLNAESDLWFMQEGFRCKDGWWRKWIGQEMADIIQEKTGNVRVLGDFGQDDIPYARMPPHYRCWLPAVMEGNCFVDGKFKVRGQTLMSSSMDIKNQKPGSFKNVWSNMEKSPLAKGVVEGVEDMD